MGRATTTTGSCAQNWLRQPKLGERRVVHEPDAVFDLLVDDDDDGAGAGGHELVGRDGDDDDDDVDDGAERGHLVEDAALRLTED